jgi:hypothetical protein
MKIVHFEFEQPNLPLINESQLVNGQPARFIRRAGENGVGTFFKTYGARFEHFSIFDRVIALLSAAAFKLISLVYENYSVWASNRYQEFKIGVRSVQLYQWIDPSGYLGNILGARLARLRMMERSEELAALFKLIEDKDVFDLPEMEDYQLTKLLDLYKDEFPLREYFLDGERSTTACVARVQGVKKINKLHIHVQEWGSLDPKDLELLAGLPIKRLVIEGNAFSDEHLSFVEHLPNLEAIEVSGSNITGDFLRYLNDAKKLKEFHLPLAIQNNVDLTPFRPQVVVFNQ